MSISTLMTHDVARCASSDSLQRAAQLLWEHDCGALPVVDHDGHVVGMITDRDICMAAYTQGRRLADLHVSSAMSKRVHSVRADDRLDKVHEVMRKYRVRRLPVVDASGHLAGLVSINDLVGHAHLSIGGPCDEVAGNRVLLTLAAIDAHRAPSGIAATPGAAVPPTGTNQQRIRALARPF